VRTCAGLGGVGRRDGEQRLCGCLRLALGRRSEAGAAEATGGFSWCEAHRGATERPLGQREERKREQCRESECGGRPEPQSGLWGDAAREEGERTEEGEARTEVGERDEKAARGEGARWVDGGGKGEQGG